MKNKIVGTIAMLWGGGIVIRWLVTSIGGSSTAYQVGQIVAVVIGAILFVWGLKYFRTPAIRSEETD